MLLPEPGSIVPRYCGFEPLTMLKPDGRFKPALTPWPLIPPVLVTVAVAVKVAPLSMVLDESERLALSVGGLTWVNGPSVARA